MQEMQKSLFPALNEVFTRFEQVAATIPAELDAEYHSIVRQHLHPLMMCAPFIHHIYAKPLGYAGDFGALEKLLSDPYEGHTLFAKLLNAWLVLSPAGEAYRNRIQVLETEYHEQALRCHAAGTDLRVLSIGCGAANEVVSFLGANDLCNSAELTLVDFNHLTIAEAKRQVESAMREHWRLTRINFERMSIQGLIMDESRMNRKAATSYGPVVKAGGYDFIYCTGLFDYFSDRVCKRILGAMYSMLAPGGKLLVCNFTPENPIRHFMKYVLDWDLTHRSAEDMRRIAPDGVQSSQCRIEHSPLNVEVYLHITKPA
jgi:extracellular factor (EF) 3-hydroxypalmitic acid methyl ester biosynthesis protein